MEKKQYITPAAAAYQMDASGPLLVASNSLQGSSINMNFDTMETGDGDDAAVKGDQPFGMDDW